MRTDRPAAAREPRRSAAGLTIIELLVVIAVIAALMALSFPAVGAIRARLARNRTHDLVLAVSAAISAYHHHVVTLADGRVRNRWDFNGDGLLDGDPATDDTFSDEQRSLAAASGYHGFYGDTGAQIARRDLDAQDRVRDAWGSVLRIGIGSKVYGGSGIGIWSSGPDRLTETDDDIVSWR